MYSREQNFMKILIRWNIHLLKIQINTKSIKEPAGWTTDWATEAHGWKRLKQAMRLFSDLYMDFKAQIIETSVGYHKRSVHIFTNVRKSKKRVSHLCTAKVEHCDRYICSIIEFYSVEKVDIDYCCVTLHNQKYLCHCPCVFVCVGLLKLL